MSNFHEENIKNIIRQNINKLEELKKVLDISVKIKGIGESEKNKKDNYAEILNESQDRDISDEISDLIDERGMVIEEIKNIDAAVRHYRLELPAQYSNIIAEVEKNAKSKQKLPKSVVFPEWAINLYRLMSEQQTVLENIKNTDDINNDMIKSLMDILNEKTLSIKNNRILMDKFITDGDMSAGTLYKSKK